MQEKGYTNYRSPRVFKSDRSTPNSLTKGFVRKNSMLKLEKY